MKLLFSLFGAISLLLFANANLTKSDDFAFTNQEINNIKIYGQVQIPPISNVKTRQFRGAAYRNRGGNTTNDKESADVNPFVNTIISAHPTSYEIKDLPTSDSVLIIQRDAEFIPQVSAVTVGSTVKFVNDDAFYHNVFSLTPGAKFNIGRRPTGDVYSKEVPPTKWKVLGLGPIDLFCDIHSQMNAIILSLDTPYFTRVNEDGSYLLEGLLPGTYVLRAYNRNLDLLTRKITVAENESYELDLSL